MVSIKKSSSRIHQGDSGKFMLRMPDGLREKVKDLAEKERRSMNAQIVKFVELGLKLAA